MLFSFIGAGSVANQIQNADHSEKLNLFTNMSKVPSRSTAGTTDALPGDNPSNMRAQGNQTDRDSQPVLLPVSCGYFFNIVRQLMNK